MEPNYAQLRWVNKEHGMMNELESAAYYVQLLE